MRRTLGCGIFGDYISGVAFASVRSYTRTINAYWNADGVANMVKRIRFISIGTGTDIRSSTLPIYTSVLAYRNTVIPIP